MHGITTNLTLNRIYVKNYRFKHTCNDDNDIGPRKRQKLDYHIFTCKFPISYITMSADHDIVTMR